MTAFRENRRPVEMHEYVVFAITKRHVQGPRRCDSQRVPSARRKRLRGHLQVGHQVGAARRAILVRHGVADAYRQPGIRFEKRDSDTDSLPMPATATTRATTTTTRCCIELLPETGTTKSASDEGSRKGEPALDRTALVSCHVRRTSHFGAKKNTCTTGVTGQRGTADEVSHHRSGERPAKLLSTVQVWACISTVQRVWRTYVGSITQVAGVPVFWTGPPNTDFRT